MAYQLATFRRSNLLSSVIRVRTAQVEQPYPVHMPTTPSMGQSSRYAILKLGGVRQMVEEGQDYSCPKRYLQEARASDASNRIVFQNVLGLRSDGQFKWGKPFLADAAVEVEVLDEFPGPVVAAAAGVAEADTNVTMARYRVKAIRSSQSSSTAVQQ